MEILIYISQTVLYTLCLMWVMGSLAFGFGALFGLFKYGYIYFIGLIVLASGLIPAYILENYFYNL